MNDTHGWLMSIIASSLSSASLGEAAFGFYPALGERSIPLPFARYMLLALCMKVKLHKHGATFQGLYQLHTRTHEQAMERICARRMTAVGVYCYN